MIMAINKSCCASGNFRSIAWILILSASLSWPRLTAAAELAIQNSSFESPALPGEGKQATNTVAPWSAAGIAGVFVNNGQYGKKVDPADGTQLAYLNGKAGNSLSQNLPCRIEPNR